MVDNRCRVIKQGPDSPRQKKNVSQPGLLVCHKEYRPSACFPTRGGDGFAFAVLLGLAFFMDQGLSGTLRSSIGVFSSGVDKGISSRDPGLRIQDTGPQRRNSAGKSRPFLDVPAVVSMAVACRFTFPAAPLHHFSRVRGRLK